MGDRNFAIDQGEVAMKEEDKEYAFYLMCVIMGLVILVAVLAGFSGFEHSKIESLESDLCYSLETNKVLADGFENITGYTKELDDFYEDIEDMEKRNNLNCKETYLSQGTSK